ncbi:hypothetical protein C8R44DRAFT_740981 [Mycena epipterygia]|nr:hypothetical protein C8R44DRAFT_740981 [Mycena epipterygia]
MLSRIASLTRAQWGYSAALTEVPTPSVGLSDGISDRTSVGKTLKFGTTVFGAHGLIGRSTCVVHATVITSTDGQNVDKPAIVKWSWSPRTRLREASIIEAATTRAREAGDTWVLDTCPSSYIPKTLPIQIPQNCLADAIRGIFKCYQWIYEKAKAMHRDISLEILMYHINNGKIFGRLAPLGLVWEFGESTQDDDLRWLMTLLAFLENAPDVVVVFVCDGVYYYYDTPWLKRYNRPFVSHDDFLGRFLGTNGKRSKARPPEEQEHLSDSDDEWADERSYGIRILMNRLRTRDMSYSKEIRRRYRVDFWAVLQPEGRNRALNLEVFY